MTENELIELLERCADLYEEIQVKKLQNKIREFEINKW